MLALELSGLSIDAPKVRGDAKSSPVTGVTHFNLTANAIDEEDRACIVMEKDALDYYLTFLLKCDSSELSSSK